MGNWVSDAWNDVKDWVVDEGWKYAATMGMYGAVDIGMMGMEAGIKALMPTMSTPDYEVERRSKLVRSAISPHVVIYGQVLVSGPLVAAFSTGESNKFIYLVVVLASHEVEEIGDIYFGDKLATDDQFLLPGTETPAWSVTKHLGHPDQLADADLIADARDINGDPCWTSNHTLAGRAYMVVKLEYNATCFPQGIPNIKAVVKGVKDIYDPRTETSGYSNNWALCVRDYLVKPYGLNCSANEINADNFIAAADICDELMALAVGGTEKRYTCNGSFTLDGKPIEIIKNILSAALGSLVWSQGKYCAYPAAYAEPVSRPLTAHDLRDSISIMPAPSRKNRINTVRGTFSNPAQAWQSVDFPIVQHAGALAVDGEELADNIKLLFTTSAATAQRLATIHLNRSLLGMTVQFPGKLTCFPYQPGDVVPLTLPQLGWDNKLFTVVSWSFAESGGIDLSLREESPDIYGWTADQEVGYVYPPVANIVYPPVFVLAAPTGLTATGGALKVDLSWVEVAGATSYNIYWGTEAGVTKETGTKISVLATSYNHTGRTAATEYFYVVTAFDGTRESTESTEDSATTNP